MTLLLAFMLLQGPVTIDRAMWEIEGLKEDFADLEERHEADIEDVEEYVDESIPELPSLTELLAALAGLGALGGGGKLLYDRRKTE